MTSLFTMQPMSSMSSMSSMSEFCNKDIMGCGEIDNVCIVDFDLASENMFIDETSDSSSTFAVDSSTVEKEQNSSSLTEFQQQLERGINLTMRHLQNPALRVYLPLGELLCDKTRKYMTMLWLRDMESELWSIMYQGHSDVFGAFDVLLAFQWRICSVTDLATDNATYAVAAVDAVAAVAAVAGTI